MKEILETVLRLQPQFSAAKTDEMELRGLQVRREGPEWIRRNIDALQVVLPDVVGDLSADGRDGTGLKTEIPWFRLFSKSRSPKARFGWYLMYLFDAVGETVYLSLNQGTTVWARGDFSPIAPSVLAARVAWARRVLGEDIEKDPRYQLTINLRSERSDLGEGYERGNVVALGYTAGAVPLESALLADLLQLTRLLGKIYVAEETKGGVPGEVSAEVMEAEAALQSLAGKTTSTGRGFRPNAKQRNAIEYRAMEVATSFFEGEGWTVEDVSREEPFDLQLRRGDEERHVEVKGTVGDGECVVLTRNEVAHMRKAYPGNALAIVSAIELDGSADAPVARAGTLRVMQPWLIVESDLTALAFEYRVPRGS